MISETDLETFSLKTQFAKHAQDSDDLQNEMAGRDVGRIARFLTAETREDKINGKRGSRKDAALTNLQILMMNDPAYAQLHRETQKTLHQSQSRLDTALETVLRAKDEAEERLQNTQSDAARAEEEVRLQALKELEAEILGSQAEIGDMQERMADEDNPVQSDEMKQFQERAKQLSDDVDAKIAPFVEQAPSQASASAPTPQTLEIPEL